MIEVVIRLTDEGQLQIGVSGEPVSPLVHLGMLEASKQLIVNHKPEEKPRIVGVDGAAAQAIASKVKAG